MSTTTGNTNDPITCHRVKLPWNLGSSYLAVVLENVFTPQECDQLISTSERQGYQQALVNVGGGRQVSMTDVRNNDRCIIDDAVLADQIWQRIVGACQALEEETKRDLRLDKLEKFKLDWPPATWKAVGLNERLRFLRYKPGTFFSAHRDGSYTRETGPRRGETSFVTCQLYLNQDCQGGATRFLSDFDQESSVSVIPKTGSVLLFDHDLLHEGCPVTDGRKYVIRTDIMYSNK